MDATLEYISKLTEETFQGVLIVSTSSLGLVLIDIHNDKLVIKSALQRTEKPIHLSMVVRFPGEDFQSKKEILIREYNKIVHDKREEDRIFLEKCLSLT